MITPILKLALRARMRGAMLVINQPPNWSNPMSSLIWNPDVTVMGQTQFNQQGLLDWINLNHLEAHTAPDPETPLALLWADVPDEFALERMIEFGGRHCYRSWDQGRERRDYIRNIIEMGHGSVLEHSTVNLAIQGVSRSLSHELVRHRVGVAISQESQRYVNAQDINFVVPPIVAYLNGGEFEHTALIDDFLGDCKIALGAYLALQSAIKARLTVMGPSTRSKTMDTKRANEAARSMLPNAAETRLLWTPNMRLLRHFLWLRGGSAADLEIRRLAVAIFDVVQPLAPAVFSDFGVSANDGEFGVPIIVAKP